MKYSFPSKNNGRLKSIEIYEGEENNLLLLEIKKEKGNTFFKYLKEIIEEGYRDWETDRKSVV